MDLARVAQWEWLLILLIVLGLAIAELVALNRGKRSEEARRAAQDGVPAGDEIPLPPLGPGP